ncbi:MAG: hypothetical protein FJ137_02850, partial [Deltaproteobacteria bacterium]|nr:hypothetical protein [Deltaproteobacteria bacterium]
MMRVATSSLALVVLALSAVGCDGCAQGAGDGVSIEREPTDDGRLPLPTDGNGDDGCDGCTDDGDGNGGNGNGNGGELIGP